MQQSGPTNHASLPYQLTVPSVSFGKYRAA